MTIITATIARNVRKMETITVTIQKIIKNYLRRMNVITKIQSKITAIIMSKAMSWYAVPDAVNLKNSDLVNSSIFGDTIEPGF